MSDVQDLVARINAEVSAHQQKLSQLRADVSQEAKDRQERLGQLEQVFDQLRGVWAPRLESLVRQFKESVNVTPTTTPGRRQGTFEFKSPVAHITLRFTASAD
jgi:hypothetical protein